MACPEVGTLAEMLGAQGWSTAAFVTNYLGSDVFGLGRGFQRYRFYRERGADRAAVYLRSDAVLRRIERWLARGVRQPFLLYVHVTIAFPLRAAATKSRPAVPAGARPGSGDRRAHRSVRAFLTTVRVGTRPAAVSPADNATLRDLYDGEIRFADEYFGRLLDLLRARGLLDDSLVVLTSDHGEEFLEHGGVGHGQTLHAEVLDVPLLLRLPGGAAGGARVDRLVQHADLLPTMLEAAGVDVPPGLDGHSWLGPGAPASTVEIPAMLRLGPFAQDTVVGEAWKAIRKLAAPPGHRLSLFDTRTDPGERQEIGASSPVLLGYARSRLRELHPPFGPGPRVPDERLDRLRGLGYLVE
jgi:arylsulfatase A-like enzyme